MIEKSESALCTLGFFLLSLRGLSDINSCSSPYPWSSTGGLSEKQIRKFVLKYWRKKFWYISHHFFSAKGDKKDSYPSCGLCLSNFSIFFSKKSYKVYAIWPTSLLPISLIEEYLKEARPKFEDWYFRQSFSCLFKGLLEMSYWQGFECKRRRWRLYGKTISDITRFGFQVWTRFCNKILLRYSLTKLSNPQWQHLSQKQ